MNLFLILLLVAVILSVLFVLIRGLVNMAGTTVGDLEGEGPSDRALKSNKLMQQRILLQALAIGIIALILLFASGGN
ncbi:twin transmembrane helix small protein [Sphingomonas sp. M1-B02]|uniref:twin transmembrane helix small protein n=1 Tax=Sphingomonas sp. M1-B02 TaxID=3114300 RepID=UPI00224045E3|nr:twin transmembrane helix small protein [Sphingomonas sp. S6-11]UZK64890.1 twin transmembrane helix small protein [Sphingomonas sp. S6-11]